MIYDNTLCMFIYLFMVPIKFQILRLQNSEWFSVLCFEIFKNQK